MDPQCCARVPLALAMASRAGLGRQRLAIAHWDPAGRVKYTNKLLYAKTVFKGLVKVRKML